MRAGTSRLTILNRGLSAIATLILIGGFMWLLIGWPFGAATAGELSEWIMGLAKAVLGRFRPPLN